jgi:predicted dehydrogenase
MAEFPSYAIVGRGRWAGVMREILTHEGRAVAMVADARQRKGESEAEYMGRLAADLNFSGAGVAWICVPPGPHILLMLRAALDVGVHVVVEKPWLCERQDTGPLVERARSLGLAARFRERGGLGIHRALPDQQGGAAGDFSSRRSGLSSICDSRVCRAASHCEGNRVRLRNAG